MEAVFFLILIVGAVVGVLVKVAVDLAGYVRRDRAAHGGRMGQDALLRVGIVVMIVVLLLAWTLVAFVSGDPVGVPR